MKHIFWHDYETTSVIDIRKTGSPIYAADKSTDALCMAYAYNDEAPQLWLPGMPVPDMFVQAIHEGWEFHAWNAAFERYITRLVMARRYSWPLPPLDLYRCTMAKARYNNLPGKLEDCGERLKIPKEFRKDAEGHKIMLKVSKPNKRGVFNRDPELMQKTYDYCIQDIVAERYIDGRLFEPPDSEWEVWKLDRTINERGCPVDVPYCRSAFNLVETIGQEANVEIRELTKTPEHPNGEVLSTNCIKALKAVLVRKGVNVGSLSKEVVPILLATPGMDKTAKRLIELRQLGAPAAVKKYKAAIEKTSADGMVRESLMYYGASATGRWSATATDSSTMQLQNMFRKVADEATMEVIAAGDRKLLETMYINPMEGLQMGVRGLICAPKGHSLVISDATAIEARIVLWLAGARTGLKLFEKSDAKTGPEPYCVMGSKVYSVPVESVKKGTQARAVGKEAVLGLGFGMGATKFQGSAKTKAGVDLTMPMCEKVVKMWRAMHPEVCKLWRDCEMAFKKAVAGAKEVKVNARISFHNVGNGIVGMKLPSGRMLFYHEAKALKRGVKFLTTKGWEETWGGHLVENAVQAIARDIIVYVMSQLEALHKGCVLTIHDEIVQCVLTTLAESVKESTHTLMRTNPPW